TAPAAPRISDVDTLGLLVLPGTVDLDHYVRIVIRQGVLDHAVQRVRVDERQAAVGMIAHDRHMGRLSAPPADDGDVTRASLLRRERIAPAGPTALPEPVVPGFSAVALLVVGVEPAVSTCDRDQADAVDGPGLATSMTPLRPFEFARLLHELSRRHQGSPPPLSPPSHP